MSAAVEVRVPDIGDFKDVPVIEVLVKPGQTIAKETPLVVLESEKASMEVPSPAAGTVEGVSVRVGDKVSQGSVLLTVRNGESPAATAASSTIDLLVPDLGDFKDVPVVEVLVKPGQTVAKETPLAVLESEKA
ncbi:MAG TPA: biotin/lipoyl-containing protein, partial [Candidatus Tumulicola sp.]|nr:biotin/lipoyl-containing protein [Candidatus Tumulicola sp.]